LAVSFFGSTILLTLGGTTLTTSPASPIGVAGWAAGSIAALLLAAIIALVVRCYHRQLHPMRLLAAGGVAAAFSQLLLGMMVAIWLSHPVLTSLHLLAAMITLGLAVALITLTYLPTDQLARANPASPSHQFYFRSIKLAIMGFLLLLVTGSFVTNTQAGLACADWPLCQGEIFPTAFSLPIAISLLHRFSVVVVSVLVVAVILQTRRRYPHNLSLVAWSKILGFLFLAQIGTGGLHALAVIPQGVISVIHIGLSLAIWSSLVVLAVIGYCSRETATWPAEAEARQSQLPARQKAVVFFKLTKPWILGLLLLTTITAMVIAAEGLPPISLTLYTLLGGFLSAGGASVLNSYIDSDIDQLMSRTSRRATVTGLVTPQETLLLGLTLNLLSFLVFALFVNLFSALLSTIGMLYYVFFYTLYLKRTTIHNIIIGGAAGAIPPLVGWTAVTNTLDLSAFYLFAIIFFWTPPHTWALALLVKKDYAQARVPMLPVVAGEKGTTYQIFLYSILLITLTLLPFTIQMVSGVYLIVALLLGARFIYLAWKLWRNYDKSVSRKLYKFSQAYLALLFLTMALDRTLF
jgi:protoheme IX farnesyltransferase